MKKTILFAVLLSIINISYMEAQKPNAIYLRFKSKTEESEEGIYRSNSKTNNAYLYKTLPIHFILESKSKKITQFLTHYNFNVTELAKIRKVTPEDQMEILTKPQSFLKFIKGVDLDKYLSTHSKQEVDNYINSLRGKTIYVIDENDFTNGGIFGINKTMKLFQVKVSTPRPYSDFNVIE